MKKHIIILLALISLGCTVKAQTEQRSSLIDTIRKAGEHYVGWVRSHPFDNWTLDMNIGGHLYYGFEDSKGSLFKRVMPQFEAQLGHWMFPVVGLRGAFGTGSQRGFISKESYLQNRSVLTADYGNCWGPSSNTLISGNDTIRGALGGYYWPLDNNDNLFVQNWKYLYAGLDLMVNLSYMKKYDRIKIDSSFQHIVYAGFNVRVGISEDNPEKFSNRIGYSHDWHMFKNTNFAAEGHLGYICRYALTPYFAVQGDARLSIMEGNFDRERITGVERMAPDIEFSLMAGICYDFNFRSKERRQKYYVEKNIIPYNTTEMPKFVAFIQQEDLDVVRYIDLITIVQYDTINDSVAILYHDTLVTRYKASSPSVEQYVPDSVSFDSIMMKRMLPYEMVFFDLDKWDIRPKEEMKIAKMARLMKAYPDKTFYLYGSADSKTGTVKRNDFLSKNRADIVYNRLILEYGIPEKQLKREYLGGILDYDPFILNRTTVIIMDHPAVREGFEKMKAQRKAGGNVVEY